MERKEEEKLDFALAWFFLTTRFRNGCVRIAIASRARDAVIYLCPLSRLVSVSSAIGNVLGVWTRNDTNLNCRSWLGKNYFLTGGYVFFFSFPPVLLRVRNSKLSRSFIKRCVHLLRIIKGPKILIGRDITIERWLISAESSPSWGWYW